MTTIVLETAGGALGTALGGPIGGMAGRVVGAVAGSALGEALLGLGNETRFVEGPRLSEISGLTSTEGEPIPRVYGRARIGGTLIWASRPLEVATTTVARDDSGSKGGGDKTVETDYAYYVDLAVALCAGSIAFVRRVWADGTELDLTGLRMRVHRGGANQMPDPAIVAREGDDAPAYRGLAYAVFERLPLSLFGNRIPQLSFEVIRPVDGIAATIRAICLIPGSTEFGLDPAEVHEDKGFGATEPANRFQLQERTDIVASLDALQALCPRLERVSVVVSWFGDDLRAGSCTIAPRVDSRTKATYGDTWLVDGSVRATARLVSRTADGPAYGGTPSDAGLKRLVSELKQRGLAVVLYPFVMMDVPANNTLPDPRRPGEYQQPYPWRGRITCHPAPGHPGSPDGTGPAEAQIDAFFGGPNGYRAFVLRYAELFVGRGLAGFVIGSEFVGLTRVRGPGNTYPAVTHLCSLAQAVRNRLGSGVELVYAADWTEYGAHVRNNGNSIRFPLDPLFAHPAIDAVGIDYYPPISDWRDGDHLDADIAENVYDRAYLKDRLGSGEAFDWFYADDADRNAQIRTPITDGAHGKPWIYRAKDLVSWWSNRHVERDGGEETVETDWIPRSKPIWLTEIGIPAVDRGTNGPNVFPDPKSSENAQPPFSRGIRDELIQARGLEAILSRFDPDLPGFVSDHNPIAPGSGRRMVDPANIYVWCWDARPFPAFPDFDLVWSDAGNWALGHWITGRAEGVELDRLLRNLLADFGIDAPLRIDADGFLDGYVIDRPVSARGALEPLARLFDLCVTDSAGILRIRDRAARQVLLDRDDLILPAGGGDPLRLVRAEESALPRSLTIGFTESEGGEYRRAAITAERSEGGARREVAIDAAIVTRRGIAQGLAQGVLEAGLAARDTAAFGLSPRRIELEPGDRISLPVEAGRRPYRIQRIASSSRQRDMEASSLAYHGRWPDEEPVRRAKPPRRPPPRGGRPFAVPLALPLTQGVPPVLLALAAAAEPWPGRLALWRSDGDGAPFRLKTTIRFPACLGKTLDPLPPGRPWRFDRGTALEVELRHAQGLAAIDDLAALSGGNSFALVDAGGAVEIVTAAGIALVGENRFRLTRLLRGLGSSETTAARTLPAGSTIVRIDDGTLVSLSDRLDEAGRTFLYRLGPAGRDVADPAFAAFEASVDLTALRPRAPVHPKAWRNSEGVHLSWIRRGRIDADSWEIAEIPLDEVSEAYSVEILDEGGSVLRRLAVTQPRALYPTAQELADFGAPRIAIEARIAQLSAVAGSGEPLRARVPIRAP